MHFIMTKDYGLTKVGNMLMTELLLTELYKNVEDFLDKQLENLAKYYK